MAQQPTRGSQYTVQSGDTLWGIAQRAYGDAEDWDTIYADPANKKLIGNNPNLIYPGQVLNIPKDPDPSGKKPVPPSPPTPQPDPFPSAHAAGHGPSGPPPSVSGGSTPPPPPPPPNPDAGDNILGQAEDVIEGEIKEG
jgi:LysM repeat protein